MLYYKFKNHEEFQNIFGTQKHSNGVYSRKNKILLSYIKNRELLHGAVAESNAKLIHLSSMAELKKTVREEIQRSGEMDEKLTCRLLLNGETFYSESYYTDENNGLCEDGDMRTIRYINQQNGRIYKMKAGKLYRAIILQTEFGKKLPEQVLVYLCEEFAAEWQTYTMGKVPKNKLVVNTDFERIYSSDMCVGDFGSCMVDKNLHSFYNDSVDARAASLENEEGKIIARCIIYDNVEDQEGNIWRLAERQYATGGSDILKRALVDALIREKQIDGYKQVGAGCGDSRAFVDIEGNSLSEKKFKIRCDLDSDDTLSYQDSFKFYCDRKREADNYGMGDIALDITEGSLDYDEENGDYYDDYHGYYCDDATVVYHNGADYYCDTDHLEDFIWIEGLNEYHHKSDVYECPECNEYFLRDQGYMSELTDETYCGECCLDYAEKTYKEQYWYYSNYDEEYFEEEESLTTYKVWNAEMNTYNSNTIHVDTLEELLEKGELYSFDGESYDEIDQESGLPLDLVEMAV